MFEIFRRKKSAEAAAIEDIELTMLKTFQRIQDHSANTDNLRRTANIAAALAAMTGAIRDTYPNFPIEKENIVFAFIEANANGPQADLDGLADAITNLVKRCPNQRKAKIDTMMYMIAPKMMKR